MPKSLRTIRRLEFIKFLEYIGCTLQRTRGDHSIYSKPGLKRSVVITKDKEVPNFHIRTNFRTLGMSYEEFLEIYKKIK